MSETFINEQKTRRPVSAYQQLSGILNALKTEEMTINDAMNKIQLKDLKPERPYCKVTSSGALALYGISKQPIVMYADQWNKFLKVSKSNYIENYMKYNDSRLKYKTYKKTDNSVIASQFSNDNNDLDIDADNI